MKIKEVFDLLQQDSKLSKKDREELEIMFVELIGLNLMKILANKFDEEKRLSLLEVFENAEKQNDPEGILQEVSLFLSKSGIEKQELSLILERVTDNSFKEVVDSFSNFLSPQTKEALAQL